MLRRFALAAAIAIAAPVPVAYAQRPSTLQGPLITGFLCCNMFTYGVQMGDGNYREEGTSLLPVGTPTQVTGYERHFVYLNVGGKIQRLKNDYSRDVAMTPFAYRYVVNEDPRVRIAAFEPRVRDAIQAAQITEGMTREQVTMAVGWPIASENPRLEADVWRYWIDPWSEYQIAFNKAGKVKAVTATPAVLDRVMYSPPN
ncbi:outer membrane protein assembly factor BamE domain-containing protein [Variovorax rhizosphaerae]|uniref:Cell envelope protein SmpA n=1 Tax=Variovorax rhizosphaerae TaxID=1836200 RepID=A0ABU8WGN9_9BURK